MVRETDICVRGAEKSGAEPPPRAGRNCARHVWLCFCIRRLISSLSRKRKNGSSGQRRSRVIMRRARNKIKIKLSRPWAVRGQRKRSTCRHLCHQIDGNRRFRHEIAHAKQQFRRFCSVFAQQTGSGRFLLFCLPPPPHNEAWQFASHCCHPLTKKFGPVTATACNCW